MLSFSRAVGLLLLCTLVFASPVRGEEKSVRPRMIPEGWRLFFGRVPLGFVSRAAELTTEIPSDALSIQDAGVPNLGKARSFDLSKWMRECGLKLPEGSIAVYQFEPSSVFALAPAEDIEILETLIGHTCQGPAIYVRITGALVEMNIPRTVKTKGIPYRRLRSVAGASWKELEELQVSTKSGQRATVRKGQGRMGPDQTPKSADTETGPVLAPDEAGTALAVEPVIGPDGETIDLSIDWLRRTGSSIRPNELELITAMIIRNGESAVAGVWPADSSAANGMKTVALVITVELVTPENVAEAEAFAERFRQNRERALQSR